MARRVQAEIGIRLRSIYDVVLAEPVPDEWLELLRKREIGDGGLVGLDCVSAPGVNRPVVAAPLSDRVSALPMQC